jgi:protein-L-isoaspartate(D-aspartate) O-methyltransferase
MEPRDVSKLLQAVRPRVGEKALAICAPAAAAVMAEIGLTVIARLPEDAACAAVLAELGVSVEIGDPAVVSGGPYDLIVCEGAVTRAPQAWIDALDAGGRLGVVERTGPVGKARLYVRGDDGLVARREVFDATPPMLRGFEAAPGFAF